MYIIEFFARTKKRVIGTLDVAFKKRFFALSGGNADPAAEGGKSARKFVFKGVVCWWRHEYFYHPKVVGHNYFFLNLSTTIIIWFFDTRITREHCMQKIHLNNRYYAILFQKSYGLVKEKLQLLNFGMFSHTAKKRMLFVI